MTSPDTQDIARKNIFFASEEVDGTPIKGFDFSRIKEEGITKDTIAGLFASFASTGFQASHLAQAIDIIKTMRAEGCTIYLGYTSNLVTSGLRDVFRYLAEQKLIDVIVTTAGGIEEDFIKCFGDFTLGTFSSSGELLAHKGVNRTGNIFIPNERYCRFEAFVTPILTQLYDEQQKTGTIHTTTDLIHAMATAINDETSIYYWCKKHDIKVYCPSIIDGSLGDMIHFFKYNHPDFKLDMTDDIHALNEYTILQEKTGVIILGGGIVKHHILNANMMRNGSDYAVYINAGQEWDGADANARPDEAVSWGKVKSNKEHTQHAVKIFGDATILFPLLVLNCFVD